MRGNQSGFSLIETLVAVAIVGLTTVIFLTGLTASVETTVITDEKSTALATADAQMEFIQNQPYEEWYDPGTPSYAFTLIDDIPQGYSIGTPMVSLIDPKGDGMDNDDGLQRIHIRVRGPSGERSVLIEGVKSIFYREDDQV